MAVADIYGIKSDFIPRVASGHCAGIARTNQTCGALSGGVMALSLKFGRNSRNESLDELFLWIQDFIEQFERKFGSVNCRELTGCDLSTPEGRLTFKKNSKRKLCQEITEAAALMALHLMQP